MHSLPFSSRIYMKIKAQWSVAESTLCPDNTCPFETLYRGVLWFLKRLRVRWKDPWRRYGGSGISDDPNSSGWNGHIGSHRATPWCVRGDRRYWAATGGRYSHSCHSERDWTQKQCAPLARKSNDHTNAVWTYQCEVELQETGASSKAQDYRLASFRAVATARRMTHRLLMRSCRPILSLYRPKIWSATLATFAWLTHGNERLTTD